jgi:hypothetical protein
MSQQAAIFEFDQRRINEFSYMFSRAKASKLWGSPYMPNFSKISKITKNKPVEVVTTHLHTWVGLNKNFKSVSWYRFISKPENQQECCYVRLEPQLLIQPGI